MDVWRKGNHKHENKMTQNTNMTFAHCLCGAPWIQNKTTIRFKPAFCSVDASVQKFKQALKSIEITSEEEKNKTENNNPLLLI